MLPKRTKTPGFAVLPFRQGKHQDVFFYHIEKTHGYLRVDEQLREKYVMTPFGVSQRDHIIALLSAAGITVRYYDPEEKKWMDQSTKDGLVPAPGQRDGAWSQPTLDEFKLEYMKIHFGASTSA